MKNQHAHRITVAWAATTFVAGMLTGFGACAATSLLTLMHSSAVKVPPEVGRLPRKHWHAPGKPGMHFLISQDTAWLLVDDQCWQVHQDESGVGLALWCESTARRSGALVLQHVESTSSSRPNGLLMRFAMSGEAKDYYFEPMH